MDEIEKEQRLCAIYVAATCGKFRCVRTIYDCTIKEEINHFLDRIIELVEARGQHNLVEELKLLRKE